MSRRAHRVVGSAGPLWSLAPWWRGGRSVLAGVLVCSALAAPSAEAAAGPLPGGSSATPIGAPARRRYVPELASPLSWGPKPVAPVSSASISSAPVAAPVPRGANREGKAHVFSLLHAHPIKILYFHGAGQPTYLVDGQENELVRRVAASLKAAGVPHELHSLPWESNPSATKEWLRAERGRFVVAGHGAGGSFAAQLARELPERVVAAFLISPATRVSATGVPTLVIRGTEDHVGGDLEQAHNLSLLRPEHADHSLRVRPGAVGDKLLAATSDETRAMNLAVAGELKRFLATAVPSL